MISLGGLVSQKAFGKFEMGKVISNPFANAFIKEAEGEDHEVSMANNSLDTIIKMATELKAKMGENEKDIPAWIQDHITNAANYISQASTNYHEYGQNEARIAEDKGPCWQGYKQVGMKDKGGRQVPNCVPNESVVNEAPAKSTGEKIQNLNNRIKALKDKMAATKSSEQKNLIQQRLKNALQTLSNYKKQNENVVNEDNTPFETLMLIRNLEQTNKLLAQDLKTSKRLPNDKKENIKKSIVINQGLINYYKENLKNLKNNESVNEAGGRIPKLYIKIEAVKNKIKALEAERKAKYGGEYAKKINAETDPKKKTQLAQPIIAITKQIVAYQKNLINMMDDEEKYYANMGKDDELDPNFS